MTVSATDHAAIADHLARYCLTTDSGDVTGWVALWAEDGVFAGKVEVKGREQLTGIVQSVQRRASGVVKHMIVNLACDYEGNTDLVRANYYNLVTTWADKAEILGLVVTCATLVRNGEGWLIQRLAVSMLRADAG